MEKDNLVRVTKKCPYCGTTRLYRRVREGDNIVINANKLSIIGRVRELLINSEKASASPIFEENVERFSCIRFSITHGHDPIILQ